MNNEIEYLAEENSKQSVEGYAWFLLTDYKMLEERNDLNMELLGEKEAELTDLENSQLIHIAKNENESLWREEQERGWKIIGDHGCDSWI